MLADRASARAAGDFATADRLRDELAALGVEVRDTPGGQEMKVRKQIERGPTLAGRPSSGPSLCGRGTRAPGQAPVQWSEA